MYGQWMSDAANKQTNKHIHQLQCGYESKNAAFSSWNSCCGFTAHHPFHADQVATSFRSSPLLLLFSCFMTTTLIIIRMAKVSCVPVSEPK